MLISSAAAVNFSRAVQHSFHIPQRMFTLEHPQIDPRCASAHFNPPYHSHCSLAWSHNSRFSTADTVQLCTAGGYSASSFVSYRHAQYRCTQAVQGNGMCSMAGSNIYYTNIILIIQRQCFVSQSTGDFTMFLR